MTQTLVEKSPNTKHRDKVQAKEWQIAEAAYYLAEKRGFAPGQEWEDWFRAERAITANHSDPEKMGVTIKRR
jgi:hypothetical protein